MSKLDLYDTKKLARANFAIFEFARQYKLTHSFRLIRSLLLLIPTRSWNHKESKSSKNSSSPAEMPTISSWVSACRPTAKSWKLEENAAREAAAERERRGERAEEDEAKRGRAKREGREKRGEKEEERRSTIPTIRPQRRSAEREEDDEDARSAVLEKSKIAVEELVVVNLLIET